MASIYGNLIAPMMRHLTILSGGQTGVDRAALDIAIANGLAWGGWCPRGGWAEDLPEPPGLLARYPALRATPLPDPLQRTEWNVRDGDCLLVLTDRSGLTVSAGTMRARDLAAKLGKPCLVLDLDAQGALDRARAFLGEGEEDMGLTIAGPRESEAPGIYAKACAFLRQLL
ncbi:MAG: putative molybdenum carrier protein [Methyloceanibacter sp.]